MCPLHRFYSQCSSLILQLCIDQSETTAPVLKHQTSFQHPFSSHPPNSHAILSTSVTLCALIACVGNVPQTGARLQYMAAAGASGASFACGRCGVCLILSRSLGSLFSLSRLSLSLGIFAGTCGEPVCGAPGVETSVAVLWLGDPAVLLPASVPPPPPPLCPIDALLTWLPPLLSTSLPASLGARRELGTRGKLREFAFALAPVTGPALFNPVGGGVGEKYAPVALRGAGGE